MINWFRQHLFKTKNYLFLLIVATSPCWAQQLFGKVVGISDGDTLTVLVDKQQMKVRLAEIDAPEKAQPFGQKSRQSLSSLCFQKRATVDVQDTDRYDRSIAKVTCDGVDANVEQVRSGMAWVYRRYSEDAALIDLETEAQQAGRGLWLDPSPVPPWEWRKQNK